MSSRRDDRTTISPAPQPPVRRAQGGPARGPGPASTVPEQPRAEPAGRPPLPVPRPNSRPAAPAGARAGLPGPPVEDDDDEPTNPTGQRVARSVSPALRQPRSYKSFRWSNLEKVSSGEVDLLRRVEWVLPAEPRKAAEAFQERLKALFEQEVKVQLHHVYLSAPDKLREQVPDPAYLAHIALAPHLTRGLLEVELALAHAAIDQLLGGAAGEAVVLRPLTEIEEGVLGYVMVEGLKALSGALDPERPRLRLESAVHALDDALAALRLERELVVLQFTLSLGEVASGYLRLFLPGSALRELQPNPASEASKQRRATLFAEHAHRLPPAKAPLWAEIGHIELSTSDLRSLSAGDVVLVENLTARPDKGEGGTAKLKVGQGQAGHWLAEVAYAEGGLSATLTELHLGPELPPGRPTAETTEPLSPEGAEGRTSEDEVPAGALPGSRTGESTLPADENPWDEPEHTAVTTSPKPELDAPELLSDIPLHVAVELARVQVTAEEVVALRVGQVVSLNKSPGDPVELSVNGKIVAHGELVEVEGQLGVRVTALAG